MKKLCKHCIWNHHEDNTRPDPAGDQSICAHPKNVKRLWKEAQKESLVTGKKTKRELTDFEWGYCRTQRKYRTLISIFIEHCGQSGRWFKEK